MFVICVIFHWLQLNLGYFLALADLTILLSGLSCFSWFVLDMALYYILNTKWFLLDNATEIMWLSNTAIRSSADWGIHSGWNHSYLNGQSLPSCPEIICTEIWNRGNRPVFHCKERPVHSGSQAFVFFFFVFSCPYYFIYANPWWYTAGDLYEKEFWRYSLGCCGEPEWRVRPVCLVFLVFLKKKHSTTCCDLIHTSCLTIATSYPSYWHLLPLLLPSLCNLVPAPHVNCQGSRGTSWSPPNSGLFCSRVWPQQKESLALTLVRVVLISFFSGQFSQMSSLFPDLSCSIFCGTKL